MKNDVAKQPGWSFDPRRIPIGAASSLIWINFTDRPQHAYPSITGINDQRNG